MLWFRWWDRQQNQLEGRRRERNVSSSGPWKGRERESKKDERWWAESASYCPFQTLSAFAQVGVSRPEFGSVGFGFNVILFLLFYSSSSLPLLRVLSLSFSCASSTLSAAVAFPSPNSTIFINPDTLTGCYYELAFAPTVRFRNRAAKI